MTNATNKTAPFVHYKAMVVDAVGCTAESADTFRNRIGIAYDMGEPVWMIADELKLRLSTPRKHKTPRQLAIRVYRADT